jgi:hypothetical protein
MYLQFVDNATYNDCLTAINENHMAFQYVPPEYQTIEMCKLALYDTNFQMLKFIKRYDDPEIFDLCLQLTPNRLLPFLFNECIGDPIEEMCCKLVKKEPTNIRILSHDKRTPAVCDIILKSLSNNPKLIKEVPNPSTDFLKRAIEINRSCVQYLDFDKCKIASLYNEETKQLHNLHPSVIIDSQTIESYANNTISNGHQRTNTMVCYENVKDGTIYLIKDSCSILDEIHKYVQVRFGNKNMEFIRKYSNDNASLDTIKNDQTFTEGVFYHKVGDKYEVYKKTTIFEDESWLFGTRKISKPIIEKIRIYSFIHV